jgi:DNA-directed RNA polymerase subunit RPC12/RpoP
VPIEVTCAVCGKKLTAPETALGKAVSCPKCGELVKIGQRPPTGLAEGRKAPSRAPEYLGLRVAANVLRIVAILYYVAALLGIVLFVVAFLKSRWWWSDGAAQTDPLLVLAFVLVAATVGAVAHGQADACIALRDIARNGFRSSG